MANPDSHLVQVARMCSSLAQLSIAQETNISVYGAECFSLFSLKNLKTRVDNHGPAWMTPDHAHADRPEKNASREQADSAHLGLLGAPMGYDALNCEAQRSDCGTSSVLALIWGPKCPR
ncbi:hypothetical protein CFIO01_09262 [Colletotrichum fioriniae PJ7]|uniref:Uncharacterized protein n=1 Tax=Colletotrichum fioriniae PJ7 TaxID=1445577 RepID=A0A010RVK8_9PEZI|nr:hypothetical protein CFIO01_09262 [Colletotrichum fioriniae PJ7]